jgi:tetratricopeptide (TPR) repeat protein
MADSRLQELQALFEAALALPAAEREAFLNSAEPDSGIRAEVHRLLRADADAEMRLARAIEAAGDADGHATTRMPSRLGAYRLLREIGAGGMGTVFEAERIDSEFRRRVAIKLIRGFPTEEAMQRLRRERQILADLEHPDIARLFDGGSTAEGQPYLVMEYIAGEPLDRWRTRHEPPLRERVHLVQRVARAVHHAHQRLVVHRDIKPSNLLVRADGTPVLLDFGIAKLIDSEAEASIATGLTPRYASPEQQAGEVVSTATDVFSLGIVLGELIMDTPAPATRPLPPPSQWNPQAPLQRKVRGDLDRVVLKACAVDPADRYSSAAEFADDLARWLHGEAVIAASAPLWLRLARLLRRHPLVSMLALGLIVMSLVFVWRLSAERDRAVRAEQVAREQTQAAEQVNAYLLDLFEFADPARHRGNSISAAELVALGKQRVARLGDQPGVLARLLGTLGILERKLGQSALSAQTLEQALALAELPVLERARLLDEAGVSHDYAFNHERSVARLSQALALRERELPADDPDLTSTRFSLAIAEFRLGRRGQAVARMREALNVLQASQHADPLTVASAELYLAEMLSQQGEEREALTLARKGFATKSARLEADDPDLLSAQGFLAEVLRQNGELDEAEVQLRSLLQGRIRLYGESSSQVSLALNELAMLENARGNYREAIALFERMISIDQQVVGRDNVGFAISLNNLASLLESYGDLDAAEPLMRDGLLIVQAHAAPDAVERQTFARNLGRLLTLKGKLDEAIPLLRASFEIALARSGRTHPDAAFAALRLADGLVQAGLDEEAGDMLDLAESVFADAQSAQHFRMVGVLRTRARQSARLGEPGKAVASLRRALELARAHYPPSHPELAWLRLELAELLHAQGESAEAQTLLIQVQAVLPGLHPDSALARRADRLHLGVTRGT